MVLAVLDTSSTLHFLNCFMIESVVGASLLLFFQNRKAYASIEISRERGIKLSSTSTKQL